MKKPLQLKAIDNENYDNIGLHICLPKPGFLKQEVWIVEFSIDAGYLCYTPLGEDDEPCIVASSGHKFYKMGLP